MADIDYSYRQRNDAARERLQAIVARLADDDLRRPLGYGWTVAAALAHLAFWDRRALANLEEWERAGVQPATGGADTLNDAMLPEWLALPPREAARQAVVAAQATDQKVATAPDALIRAIIDAGRERSLDRSRHRNEHLDELESVLGSEDRISSD